MQGRDARGGTYYKKTEDPYGFKGGRGAEVEAIDWTTTIYAFLMLVMMTANVGLLIWIGVATQESHALLQKLEKLEAFNDNLAAIKSSSADVALALKDTNAHLLVNTLKDMNSANKTQQTTAIAAYIDHYVGNGDQGSGHSDSNGDDKCKTMPPDKTGKINYNCGGTGTGGLPPPCLPPPSPPSPPPGLANLGPASLPSLVYSCVSGSQTQCDYWGESKSCDARSAMQIIPSNAMESTAQAITKIAREMPDNSDVETQTSTAVATMEAYFGAEKNMQDALKSAHDACECDDKTKRSTDKTNCRTAIQSFIAAEQAFYSKYNSYSGTIGGVYTQLTNLVNSADSATVTAATKADILNLLTTMKTDADAMDTWEEKLTEGRRSIMHEIEKRDHENSKKFCAYIRDSNVPSVAIATCKQSPSTPYSSSSTSVVTTNYGTMTISTCTSSS